MMTPKEVVTQWAAGFNRHDAAAAAALYHEGATNMQVRWGEPVRGQQAMLDPFTARFRALLDGRCQIEHLFEDDKENSTADLEGTKQTVIASYKRDYRAPIAALMQRAVGGWIGKLLVHLCE
jgi:ketosteroid isomerase-like protein